MDFLDFDGNPQGLRMVLRLHRERDGYGLNLTYTTILSLIKYARSPAEGKGLPLTKKPGYFESEKEIVNRIKEELQIPLTSRYPLAYIMEAADDIAYCISDIEDGIEKNVITGREFFEELKEEWSKIRKPTDSGAFPIGVIKEGLGDKEKFFEFKVSYTRKCISKAKEIYILHNGKLLDGSLSSLFSDDLMEGRAIKCLKSVARRKLFRSPEAENPELAGSQIITGLLNSFKPLLICTEDEFKKLLRSRDDPSSVMGQGLDMHWRLFNKLPRKHLAAYEDQMNEFEGKDIPEWYFRAHLVVDYISGMTDRFALELYQLLNGIRIQLS